jgi:hypothetical protein
MKASCRSAEGAEILNCITLRSQRLVELSFHVTNAHRGGQRILFRGELLLWKPQFCS